MQQDAEIQYLGTDRTEKTFIIVLVQLLPWKHLAVVAQQRTYMPQYSSQFIVHQAFCHSTRYGRSYTDFPSMYHR
jgi:hypothetical protein